MCTILLEYQKVLNSNFTAPFPQQCVTVSDFPLQENNQRATEKICKNNVANGEYEEMEGAKGKTFILQKEHCFQVTFFLQKVGPTAWGWGPQKSQLSLHAKAPRATQQNYIYLWQNIINQTHESLSPNRPFTSYGPSPFSNPRRILTRVRDVGPRLNDSVMMVK